MTSNRSYGHRHGWDCFKTSGGYLNAMELHVPLDERIAQVYRVAYRSGYLNGHSDGLEGLPNEVINPEALAAALADHKGK